MKTGTRNVRKLSRFAACERFIQGVLAHAADVGLPALRHRRSMEIYLRENSTVRFHHLRIATYRPGEDDVEAMDYATLIRHAGPWRISLNRFDDVRLWPSYCRRLLLPRNCYCRRSARRKRPEQSRLSLELTVMANELPKVGPWLIDWLREKDERRAQDAWPFELPLHLCPPCPVDLCHTDGTIFTTAASDSDLWSRRAWRVAGHRRR